MAIANIPSTSKNKNNLKTKKKTTRNFSNVDECIWKSKRSKLIDRLPRFATTDRKSATRWGARGRGAEKSGQTGSGRARAGPPCRKRGRSARARACGSRSYGALLTSRACRSFWGLLGSSSGKFREVLLVGDFKVAAKFMDFYCEGILYVYYQVLVIITTINNNWLDNKYFEFE